MAEKMLITQALDERDLLVKKISDKIAKAKFIDTAKKNEKTMERLQNHLENLLPPDVVQDFDIYFFDDTTLAEEAKVVSINIDSYDYRIKFVVQGDQLSLYLNRNEFDFGEEEEEMLRRAGIAREEIPYFHGETKQLEFTFAEIGETANLIGDYKGVLYFNKIKFIPV